MALPETVVSRTVEVTVSAVKDNKDALNYPDKVVALMDAVSKKLMEFHTAQR